jgi:hypothetical protein
MYPKPFMELIQMKIHFTAAIALGLLMQWKHGRVAFG